MFEEILHNVFVIYSPNEGANCYLLIGKKNILIDSSLSINEDYLINCIKDVGLKTNEISMVLFTHGHIDHIALHYLFNNATFYMSSYDAEKVNRKDVSFCCSSFFSDYSFPKIKNFLADEQIIKIEPFELQVISTPGHTKGSICFYEKNKKMLFSGDTIFNGAIGRFDLPSSSKKELHSSLVKLSNFKISFLLPGHGIMLKGDDANNSNLNYLLNSFEKNIDFYDV
ncbi:MAG: MBL fold metallo-hydrolase [Candidatus Diapherotrites archaeon]|nr:MBL fold metallo-hydrolase [Candidatus Diapherotrites archaeon]